MKKLIYEIYENGVPLMKGGAYDIARAYRIQSNKISVYASKGSVVKNRYTIKKIGEIEYKYEPRPISLQSREEIIDYFIRHLEEYENVAARSHEDPTIYLEDLERKGYKCIVSRFREIDTDDLVASSKERKIGYEYTLTRVG